MLADWGEAFQRLYPRPFDDVYLLPSRQAVEQQLARLPRALVWLGHGQADALISAGLPVLDAGNIGALKGKAIIALACDAAIELGPEAERQGVRAFFGFRRRFSWLNPDPETFRSALLNGLGCLFDQGHELSCAEARFRQVLDALAGSYYEDARRTGFYSVAEDPSDALVGYLAMNTNKDGLRVIGDGTATL